MTTAYRKTSPSQPRSGHHTAEERHVMDYVRTVYRRRWIAIPVFLLVIVVGSLNAVRADADLPGPDAADDREGHAERGDAGSDVPVAGRLVQRRLLSDAVPHPAEPQPRQTHDRPR